VRILVIVNTAEAGGAETLLETLYAAWHPEDQLHLMVLLGRGTLSPRLEKSFPGISYLAMRRSGSDVVRARRSAQMVIDSFRPDIIHSNLTQSDLISLLCRSRGARRIATIHTAGASRRGERAPESRLATRAVAALSRRMDATVASHESCIAYAARVGLPRPVRTIRNGVAIPVSLPSRGTQKTLLSLSRWHPMKGHEDLFRAFAGSGLHEDGWQLACAGSGMTWDNPEIAELIERTLEPSVASAVRLLGPLEDVTEILDHSAALVLSSRYGESYPMAGMEACARGRPVIATRVGGTADFVVHPDLLVAPGDWVELSQAMRLFATMSAGERAELGAQSRTRAIERFDIAERRRQYRSVFLSLLESSAERCPS
jgi:glycosyltransferase involved in cell wall biosynthesis